MFQVDRTMKLPDSSQETRQGPKDERKAPSKSGDESLVASKEGINIYKGFIKDFPT